MEQKIIIIEPEKYSGRVNEIINERRLNIEDVVVIDRTKVESVKELEKIIKEIPPHKTVIIEEMGLAMVQQQVYPIRTNVQLSGSGYEYAPSRKELDKHPFQKFIDKKNKKRKF